MHELGYVESQHLVVVQAAKHATRTIPIVMSAVDPVGHVGDPRTVLVVDETGFLKKGV